MRTSKRFPVIILIVGTFLLQSCGGGGSTSATVPASTPTPVPVPVPVPQISSFELIDPAPGSADKFGNQVAILPNGNIIVSDPGDSSVASGSGAVHIYNPLTQTLVASIYGDTAGDSLGSGGITVLSNNNFVIATPEDDNGGNSNVGSVMLVNGTTGALIESIFGNRAFDNLGSGGITVLSDDDFVISSPLDADGSIDQAGSVMLVDGVTGAQIGSTIAGNAAQDQLGITGITLLSNDNFVIASQLDNNGGTARAGSVMLVDGATGAQLGSTITGDKADDFLGSGGITVLANDNFVISSPDADNIIGSNIDVGSVILVDGTTGAQIGATYRGDAPLDFLGEYGITALGNNNFVIASAADNNGALLNAGSVMLVNGANGTLIKTIWGDNTSDLLGFDGSAPGEYEGIIALTNNNFVISSVWDDHNGITDAGTVMLIDGDTGVQIGTTFAGNDDDDHLGFSGGQVLALDNGNFVVPSTDDDAGAVINAGSVMLVNGTTGDQMGPAITGDNAEDRLGSRLTALVNSNFVIASSHDDDDIGGIINAGSVILVNGTTGMQIGSTIRGDNASDRLGDTLTNEGVIALPNNNFVISSVLDGHNGIAFAGTVMLVDGVTGAQIGATIAGNFSTDLLGSGGITVFANSDFVIASPDDDENGTVNAGSIIAVSGTGGNQIGSTIVGTATGDMQQVTITESPNSEFYLLSLPLADNNASVDSGFVQLIVQ